MAHLLKTTRKGSLKRSKSKFPEPQYTVLDLPSLRRQRTTSFNRMTKALEQGKLAESDPSHFNLFLSYFQESKQIASSFEDVHLIILDLMGSPEEDEDELQNRFDKMYFEVTSIFLALTEKQSKTGKLNSLSNNNNSNNHYSNIRFPQITLPTFSGDIKSWPKYYDTFNSLIHNSEVLSDTEKFHYLFSTLSGDALSAVSMYPVTQEHYQSAYTALFNRYNSKRDLAYSCWRDILNVDLRFNNANEFNKSLNLLQENLKILKSIELPVDQWDFILSYHVLSKLNKELRQSFEDKYSSIELPSFKSLISFLESKCTAVSRDTHFIEHSKQGKFAKGVPAVTGATTAPAQAKRSYIHQSHALVAADSPAASHSPSTSEPRGNNNDASTYTNNIIKCSYCNGSHSISTCSDFLKKSIDERTKVATDKKWCFNCLKPSHQLKACRSVFSCRSCKRKHHTLLCRDNSNISKPVAATLVSRAQSNTTVLLATALVQVRDAFGNMQTFRALFDTGSQNNFITVSAVNRLNLQPCNTTSSISGLGEAPASIVGDVSCHVGTNDRILFHLDMHVISSICGDQPIAKLNNSGWSHIESLSLADPGYDVPGPIDILFGADVFADSLVNETIKGKPNQPAAFNSIFGWLLLGKTRLLSNTLIHTSLEIDNELNSLVQRFWEVDSLPTASVLTPDENLCEQKYVTEHSRDSSGRYILRLPFKDIDPTFVGSRDVALRRFHAIEKRLSRDPDLHSQYAEFMSDYLDSGHMSLVPPDELGLGKHYLSHHCVLRPESATTRLRVVFDASAKDYQSRSLNDTQLTGPKLQPNIIQILLRFREHSIVFMADVRQMYRQMLVAPEHRDYQRILWRFSPAETLQEYRLNTVTYGVSSSPFLACRTVRQLAEDEGDAYPIAKRIMLTDIYIDDVITGFHSYDAAQTAKTQTIEIFKRGGFQLRKWVSNEPRLLSDLPPEDCLTGSVKLDNSENPSHKVLGLKWDQKSDAFFFEIESSSRPCTKRAILSELARIFDPLGFLSPITIQAKCLIQQLWILGVTWDQTPPDEVVSAWNTYRSQLSQLSQIRIPRQLTSVNVKSYELHGFSDSSERAYGAIIFLRTIFESGEIQTHFVCSKARVVPLKRISLPRLELCAAVLFSDLAFDAYDYSVNKVNTTMNITLSHL